MDAALVVTLVLFGVGLLVNSDRERREKRREIMAEGAVEFVDALSAVISCFKAIERAPHGTPHPDSFDERIDKLAAAEARVALAFPDPRGAGAAAQARAISRTARVVAKELRGSAGGTDPLRDASELDGVKRAFRACGLGGPRWASPQSGRDQPPPPPAVEAPELLAAMRRTFVVAARTEMDDDPYLRLFSFRRWRKPPREVEIVITAD